MSHFQLACLCVLVGWGLSLLVGACFTPLPVRSLLAWRRALGAGLAWWMALYAMALLLSQRALFSVALVVVVHAVLVAINRTKWRMLREPFILQDFEYFTDALRHPRLYIPFFGIMRTLLLVSGGAAAIGLFIWLEPNWSYTDPGGWRKMLLVALVLCLIAAGLAWWRAPILSLDPAQDLPQWGMVGLLHQHLRLYLRERCRSLPLPQPAAEWSRVPDVSAGQELPHMVLIQSESFFDPRQYYPFVRRDLLPNWDRAWGEAQARGSLQVPAWGANTVRTEAAVLTGLSPDDWGIHRYNPYRRVVHEDVVSLASHLRAQGYRTLCLHPYPASFYFRDKVMPRLGFDRFIDIEAFEAAERAGQYIGDLALGRRVSELLARADKPLFIFVITMENHGPLHLESEPVCAQERFYTAPPGPLARDLSVYLDHLLHADCMLGQLMDSLAVSDRPGSLCWYGDHVPIMPEVYAKWGEPSGDTPWLIWDTDTVQPATMAAPLPAHGLARLWLSQLAARTMAKT